METCNVLAHNLCWCQDSWDDGWGPARAAGRGLIVTLFLQTHSSEIKDLSIRLLMFSKMVQCEAKRMGLSISLLISCTTKVSARTVYCTAPAFGSLRDQVFANRGITLQSTSTRRPPHCFNFLRQVECLAKAGYGGATSQFEVAHPKLSFRVEP